MVDKKLLDYLVELKNRTIDKRYKDCKTRDDAEKNKKELRTEWKEWFDNCGGLNNSPCKSCVLPEKCNKNEPPYIEENGPYIHPAPLVFFTEGMKEEASSNYDGKKNIIDIMFVSRDPHAYYGEVRGDQLRYITTPYNTRIGSVGVVIISLAGKERWKEFLNCVNCVEKSAMRKIVYQKFIGRIY